MRGKPRPQQGKDRTMSMSKGEERRKHVRHLAESLVVVTGGKTYEVVNISTGGVFFKGTGFFKGNPLSITIRAANNEMDCITADCKVVEVGTESVHAEFAKPTMPLMHFVIGHIGQAMGVKPQYFKKPEPQAAAS
jgi:hypothetical protein